MLNKNAINSLAKRIKSINEKEFNSKELQKATIKDLEKLIIFVGTGDINFINETKLYNQLYAGCQIALNIIYKYEIIEPNSIYEDDNRYYYKRSADSILNKKSLNIYYTHKIYSYIFKVVNVDSDVSSHVFNMVDKIENYIYKKESDLFFNKIIKNIKDGFKCVDNNIFIEKVENMINRKITEKEIDKIINSIEYNL